MDVKINAMKASFFIIAIVCTVLLTSWLLTDSTHSLPEDSSVAQFPPNEITQQLSERVNNLSKVVLELTYSVEKIASALKSPVTMGEHLNNISLSEAVSQFSYSSGEDLPPIDEIQAQENDTPIVVVAPTAAQNEWYEELNTLLDDPVYLATLNFEKFSSLENLGGLPEMLRMALVYKAIGQYKRGGVSKEVFFSGKLLPNGEAPY